MFLAGGGLFWLLSRRLAVCPCQETRLTSAGEEGGPGGWAAAPRRASIRGRAGGLRLTLYIAPPGYLRRRQHRSPGDSRAGGTTGWWSWLHVGEGPEAWRCASLDVGIGGLGLGSWPAGRPRRRAQAKTIKASDVSSEEKARDRAGHSLIDAMDHGAARRRGHRRTRRSFFSPGSWVWAAAGVDLRVFG